MTPGGPDGLTRRELLHRAAIALSAGPLVALASCATPADRRAAAARAAHYPRPDSLAAVRRLGERYLALVAPDRRSADVARLVDPAVRLLTEADSPDAAVSAVRQAVWADFEHGRSVWLDGWTMSATEMALCALVALES